MVNMFAKYDNLDPNYIPVNTYWPKALKCVPAAILLTRKLVTGDSWNLNFKVNEHIVERFNNATAKLTMYNFRGEELATYQTSLSETTSFNLNNTEYALLPDIYYLKLTISDGVYTYTLYDRKSKCLTII